MAEFTYEQINQRIRDLQEAYGPGSAQEQVLVSRLQSQLQKQPENQIDQERGASADIRLQVGAAQSPEDRLATMRNFYPEAIPYGEDNFLAINRRNNQPFLYNPPGMDLGDIPEYGRELVTAGAGIGGAMLASPAVATGAGAPAPVIAGGLASAGAGYLYDQSVEYLGNTVDTRTLGEQFEDYSVEAALGMLPVDKLGEPVSNFFRMGVIDPAKNAVREVVQKYGIQPTAGTVGNGLLQSLEAGSQRIGAAMGNFQQSANEMYEGIEEVIESFYKSVGGKQTPGDSGRNVVDKGKKFIDDFNGQSDRMYAAVDEFISPDSLIMPSNFGAAAQEMQFSSRLGKLFQSDRATKIVEILEEDGPIPYRELVNIRTALGKIIGKKATVGPGDIDTGQAEQLYAAITRDMEEMAKGQGDEAFEAWQAANDFYRAGKKTINEVIYPTMTSGSGKEWLSAEATQRKIAKMAAGEPADLARLQTSNVLDEQDMGRVGAGILNDLGQPTVPPVRGQETVATQRLAPGRIPAQTSNKVIHEESADVLFNMTSREILDDLRVLGASIKQTDELVNRSGTGNANLISGVLSGAGAGLVTGDPAVVSAAVLSGFVLPYLGSKGLQSKPFINWVTEGSKSGTSKEWVRAGARMAAKEGLMELYDAVIEFESGNTGADAETRGMLFE
jgi:hypothetical protein